MDKHLEELKFEESQGIFLRQVLLELECQSRTYEERERIRKIIRAENDHLRKHTKKILAFALQQGIDIHEINRETGQSNTSIDYYQNLNALNEIQRQRDLWDEFNELVTQVPNFIEDIGNREDKWGELARELEDSPFAGLCDPGIPDEYESVPKRYEKWLRSLPKLNQIEYVTKILINYFKNDQITVTPGIINDLGNIELFVKTKDKRSFALSLRSNGKSRIRWRVDKQNFYTYRDNGSNLTENITYQANKLSESVTKLINSRSGILGRSARERRKPVTKAIILLGETKLDPKNDPALWCKFGKTEKVIKVITDGLVYMLAIDDLTDFLDRSVDVLYPQSGDNS
jgi:hypothetical protein